MNDIPEWLGTAVVGAVIAAGAYVAKLCLEAWGSVLVRRRERRARLVELHSLLRASHAACKVQCENRDRLKQLIAAREPALANSLRGYEKLFSAAHASMPADEKELHAMIRTITENTLQPLNHAALEWLKQDDYWKTAAHWRGPIGELAKRLEALEVHLLLWQAKYKIWIPGDESHALVYMGDEERHGVEFPHGIESDVEKVLNPKRWFRF